MDRLYIRTQFLEGCTVPGLEICCTMGFWNPQRQAAVRDPEGGFIHMDLSWKREAFDMGDVRLLDYMRSVPVRATDENVLGIGERHVYVERPRVVDVLLAEETFENDECSVFPDYTAT